MRNITLALHIILFISFFSCNIGISQNKYVQKNCNNPLDEMPFGNPIEMYEYNYRATSTKPKERANLRYVLKYDFDENGQISSSIKNRGKYPHDHEMLKETNHNSARIYEVVEYDYQKDGKVKSKKYKIDGTIPSIIWNYTYPNNQTIVSDYQNIFKEEWNEKSTLIIDDCKVVSYKSWNKEGRLKYERMIKSEILAEDIVHFEGGKSHTIIEKSEFIKKDAQGNWIEKIVRRDNSGENFFHIFRHFVYEKPSQNYETTEELGQAFFDAFKTGNYTSLLEKGTMKKEHYMEMYSTSKEGEPYNFVRVTGMEGQQFFNIEMKKLLNKFRTRKFSDWSAVELVDVIYEKAPYNIYQIVNEMGEITLKFSDGTKSANFQFYVVHLSTGWYYCIVK